MSILKELELFIENQDYNYLDKNLLEFANKIQSKVKELQQKENEYWKQRCLLAEKCLEETLCDNDINANQENNWTDYHKFISENGNRQ
jgi:hypothetical protein